MAPEGRSTTSRHRLNGVAVNRQQIQSLRPLLLDLTVQGQTQQLARPGQQRRWLDRFGAAELQQHLPPVQESYRSWRQASAALEQAKADWLTLQADLERQQQLLDDLEAAQLEDPEERSRLENEENRLAHGVRLQEGVMTLMGRLVDAEEAPSVLDHLAACEAELSQMQQLDGSVSALNARFGDGFAELQDFIRELDRYGSSLESDPDSLGQLQERIALLKALERRHGKELSELIVWRDQLREQLVPGGAQASLEALEQSEIQARKRRDRCNGQLTQARRFAAAALEQDRCRPCGPWVWPMCV